MHETMSGDINSLGHQLNRFSERNRHFRDFTLYSLISTIKEVIACFPVYRTYVTEKDPVTEHDRRYIARAIRCAKRRAPATTSLVFDFIEQLLLKKTRVNTQEECEDRSRFIGKFQQITSPVAAKGIEDTTLYVYNRLLSLNEVGSDPTKFGLDPAAVHQWLADRQRQWPDALSALSTHDTKRGEDVRARLNVLSEIPGEWKAAVTKWRALNRRCKIEIGGTFAPDPNEEYLIYQTLVGSWPFDPGAQRGFGDRLQPYLRKALREAKVHTSWVSPDEEYEAAVLRFVGAILDPKRPFLQSFRPFQARVAELGIYNSLAQLLIKITAPGVPDFYQGTELWDFSLVDPDNRRPVDYEHRRQLLAEIAPDPCECEEMARSLLDTRASGRVKLFTMLRALQARTSQSQVFARGSYVPLRIAGSYRESVFAFARRHGGTTMITCVPRLVAGVLGDRTTTPTGPDVWKDTRIELPASIAPEPSVQLTDVFTGARHSPRQQDGTSTLEAAEVFGTFPVALLTCST